MDSLEVLGAKGHLTIKWDPANEEDANHVREEIQRLKAAGYSFFTSDDQPADEVTAGKGELTFRRIEAEEVTKPSTGRGRRTVATQPVAGG